MQTISLNNHCAHSFWQVTKALWNAGKDIHVREWSLSNTPSPERITMSLLQASTSKHCAFPQSCNGYVRAHVGIKYTSGHNYLTLLRCLVLTMTVVFNCGIGTPWWQQNINSLETKYSTFKWSSTWPWSEKTAETKDIAAWRPMLYLDASSYLLKFCCLTWWMWNYWSSQVVTIAICASGN